MSRHWSIIEAPSNLGLKPTGVEQLPQELLGHGLAERVSATRVERLEPPAYSFERDPATGIINAHSIAAWSPRLADAVESVLHRDEGPLVLGGDCSILLGSALALKRRGRYGLLFIDDHTDFYQPEAEPDGEAASMDLALATGRGPALLADLHVGSANARLMRTRDVVDGAHARLSVDPLVFLHPPEPRCGGCYAARRRKNCCPQMGTFGRSRGGVAGESKDQRLRSPTSGNRVPS